MIIPELPNFLTSLGGFYQKGLIISLFTISALISRPFSGKIADKIGRVPVIISGSVFCFVCSMLYPIMTTVFGFLLLRFFHGFSTGFTPTGQTAYISDIIPHDRRGEAMGFLGTAGTLGMAGGPAIGGLISETYSTQAMFYCSSACALISIFIMLGIKETMTEKYSLGIKIFKIRKQDLFEPKVLVPCVIMALCSFAFGNFLTIIPDWTESLEIKNKGLLFTYFTVSSLLIRLLAGRASDLYGRANVLKISTLMMAFSMFWMSFSISKDFFIIGVFLYGLAHGATSPTLLAWASELSPTEHKGRGIASLYMFMEFGIGAGAVISGFIYQNQIPRIWLTFFVCGSLCVSAFIFLGLNQYFNLASKKI